MTQEQFLKEARSWVNIFLTWYAGTGKSYVLKQYVEEVGKHNVILTSSTGISAINIWGVTMHSVFRIFWLQFNKSPWYSDLDWRAVKLIVIDEISMIGPDQFDQIDKFLRHYADSSLPFGGIQIIVVWDKAQLQPVYVPHTNMDKEIIEWFKKQYGELTFDNARCYKWFKEIFLTKIFRQDNPEFLDILQDVRDNKLEAVSKIQTDITPDVWNNSIHIIPYNRMVDAHNAKAIALLDTAQKTYTWVTTWTFNLKNCITPIKLLLKVDALVMVTANIDSELKNGTLWKVVKFVKWWVIIDVKWKQHPIMINKWEQVWYTSRWQEILWKFYQIPLKLAWASTIHKTQWLTLDRVVFHNVGDLSHNEIYVWLSRAKTLENLYVKNYGKWKR